MKTINLTLLIQNLAIELIDVILIQDWKSKKGHRFIFDRYEFDALKPSTEFTNVLGKRNLRKLKFDFLFLSGTFTKDHMSFEIDRNPSIEPSVSKMTVKAIELLKNHPNGYFLLVEGGEIDFGHHDKKVKETKTKKRLLNLSNLIKLLLKD